MSILIRGMEMPKNCEECDFAVVGDIDFEYNLFCKCSKKYCDLDAFGHPIGWNCPLIEVEFNEEQFNTVQNMLSKR